MDSAMTAVLEDARLTPDAVRLILYVASRGDGRHEISHTQFAILLNHGSDARVSRALRLAGELGYLERTAGGRGHSDRYEFSTPENHVPKDRSHAEDGTYRDSPLKSGDLKTDRSEDSKDLSDSPQDSGDLNGSVGGTTGRDVGEEGSREEVEGPPSVSPPTEAEDDPNRGLSDGAVRAIEERKEMLNGCRGALRDYLRERVPPDRQLGYVHTIAGWNEGLRPGVWKRPDGQAVPEDDRSGLLRAAFNELLAADEKMMARPIGDPGNLGTKLEIVIKQEYSRGNGQRRRSGGARSKGGGKEGGGGGRSIRGERRRGFG